MPTALIWLDEAEASEDYDTAARVQKLIDALESGDTAPFKAEVRSK